MRFWFDTEFIEDGKTVDLISIGVVSEDGRSYYAETPNARVLARQTQWLATNVSPHLSDGRHVYERWQIAQALIDFMGEKPEIWAYYADYDWITLCQLHGRMIDLPKGWPMFCRDVKQLASMQGDPKLPKKASTEHHALADARWTKEAWSFLIVRQQSMRDLLHEAVLAADRDIRSSPDPTNVFAETGWFDRAKAAISQ